MFKSCDYCRHRKKKCVLPVPRAPRCTDCQHLDIPCVFSPRISSVKRQKTSQLLAARFSSSARFTSQWPAIGTSATPAPSAEEDTQLPVADHVRSKEKIILLGEDVAERGHVAPMAELYESHVRSFAPFLPEHMLASEAELDAVLRYCIQVASYYSLHDRRVLPVPAEIEQSLNAMLGAGEPSPAATAGMILLLLRVDLTHSMVNRVGIPIQF